MCSGTSSILQKRRLRHESKRGDSFYLASALQPYSVWPGKCPHKSMEPMQERWTWSISLLGARHSAPQQGPLTKPCGVEKRHNKALAPPHTLICIEFFFFPQHWNQDFDNAGTASISHMMWHFFLSIKPSTSLPLHSWQETQTEK